MPNLTINTRPNSFGYYANRRLFPTDHGLNLSCFAGLLFDLGLIFSKKISKYEKYPIKPGPVFVDLYILRKSLYFRHEQGIITVNFRLRIENKHWQIIDGDLEMDENQAKESSLVDTTDCLEAVGVFRAMKNAFFAIALLSLLFLQASFLMVKFDWVKAANTQPAAGQEEIKKTDEKIIADPNKPILAEPKEKTSIFALTFERLAGLIQFFNFVLVLTAILYCLTMLFILKVSLLGRLGGINHICRAFFLALVFAVFTMPWQKFFEGVVIGAMFTPKELQDACAKAADYNIFATIIHYLRFTGYWLLILLLLIFAQLRSGCWSKAILRRLEVI
jgi:hypothetical protein